MGLRTVLMPGFKVQQTTVCWGDADSCRFANASGTIVDECEFRASHLQIADVVGENAACVTTNRIPL